jgi:thymidylate kinase
VTTRWISIEGPDGGGHSTHADALAAALRDAGHDARAYHHEPHLAGATGLARVCHYEASRRFVRHAKAASPRMDRPCRERVIVMDRGPWSGLVHARALEAQDTRRLDSGHSVAAAELALWWGGLPVVMLDASDATLDARLLLRGEDPRESHAERAQWRRLAAAEGWPVVDTSRPREAVAGDLLAWALWVLGGAK